MPEISEGERYRLCKTLLSEPGPFGFSEDERDILAFLNEYQHAYPGPLSAIDLSAALVGGSVVEGSSIANATTRLAERVESVIGSLRRKLQEHDTESGLNRFEIVTSTDAAELKYRLIVVRKNAFLKATRINRTPTTVRPLTPLDTAPLASGPPVPAPIVFLCHSSGDKDKVRPLYGRLKQSGFKPWLDEEDLEPGDPWQTVITDAVRGSDVVLVCLSKTSITREGFVQKEIKIALDAAEEKPEGTRYIIPARFEDCTIPTRIAKWHCVDLFKENGFDRLVKAIRAKGQK